MILLVRYAPFLSESRSNMMRLCLEAQSANFVKPLNLWNWQILPENPKPARAASSFFPSTTTTLSLLELRFLIKSRTAEASDSSISTHAMGIKHIKQFSKNQPCQKSSWFRTIGMRALPAWVGFLKLMGLG